MKKFLVALAVIALLSLGIPSAASASETADGGVTCWGVPQLALSYEMDLAQGGFLGWAGFSSVSAYHATGVSCNVASYWPEVNVELWQRVERNVYLAGWVTCSYYYSSGTGATSISVNSISEGNSGACASTTWPEGNTALTITVRGWVTGTSYTFGPNAATRVYA